jgi:gp6-like head-tail connector protein
MVMLVEVEEVKGRIRFDHDEEDADIELAINSASAAVLNYLKVPHDNYDDSFGVVTDVPFEVVQAVITLVSIWKRDPAGVEMKDWEMGYLPRPVMAILYPLRDPALQ